MTAPDKPSMAERLRRSRTIAWTVLFGMFVHFALSVGHLDGPTHRNGLLLAALERLVGPVAEGHHSDTRQDCSICLIAALGAALPTPPPGSAICQPACILIDWAEGSVKSPALVPAQHYEIRAPPSV